MDSLEHLTHEPLLTPDHPDAMPPPDPLRLLNDLALACGNHERALRELANKVVDVAGVMPAFDAAFRTRHRIARSAFLAGEAKRDCEDALRKAIHDAQARERAREVELMQGVALAAKGAGG